MQTKKGRLKTRKKTCLRKYFPTTVFFFSLKRHGKDSMGTQRKLWNTKAGMLIPHTFRGVKNNCKREFICNFLKYEKLASLQGNHEYVLVDKMIGWTVLAQLLEMAWGRAEVINEWLDSFVSSQQTNYYYFITAIQAFRTEKQTWTRKASPTDKNFTISKQHCHWFLQNNLELALKFA